MKFIFSDTIIETNSWELTPYIKNTGGKFYSDYNEEDMKTSFELIYENKRVTDSNYCTVLFSKEIYNAIIKETICAEHTYFDCRPYELKRKGEFENDQ